MRENRAFGLLLLVSTAALVFALDSRDRDDPFPINPASAKQLVYYRMNTDGDTSNHTITDPDTLRAFMDALNRAEKWETERLDLLEADWQVMIYKPNGSVFSLTIWEEGAIELRMNGTWRYGMDCKPLCAVLEAA